MEATISLDMESVLIQLQTSLFAYNVIPSSDEKRCISLPFLDVLWKIKHLSEEMTKEGSRRTMKTVSGGQKLSLRNRNKASFNAVGAAIFILDKMQNMIIRGERITRRELYYQNVELFRSQRFVDDSVNKISRILDLPQWKLGISSTSKGLVYGPLCIKLNSGAVINCSNQPGGTLVPQDIPFGASYQTDASFALVIEKDAAFQALLSTGMKGPLERCILITGKGYPDMNTRILVRGLSSMLCLPTFIIVDCDPHGIDIFFTYKYGSQALTHVNNYLVAPSIFWLGIHPVDITDHSPVTTKRLSNSDKNKVRSLLKRHYITPELLEQIHQMINRGTKCEIENISSISNNYLSDVYIPTKISRKKFI